MRTRPAALAGLLTLALFTASGLAARPASAARSETSPDSLLSTFAGSPVDHPGRADYLRKRSWARIAGSGPEPATTNEREADGHGRNDSPENAERVGGFGTGRKQNSRVRIAGRLAPEPIGTPAITVGGEDDGSIPLARETGVGTVRNGATLEGVIGDGPYGRTGEIGTNDFDFYALTARPGALITVTTSTVAGSLDTVLELLDEAGNALASNDDFDDTDSQITYRATAGGRLYVVVAAYGGRPGDPFDSGSGDGRPDDPDPPTEGPYRLTLSAGALDTDFFAINLRPGDVIGASVTGAAGYLTVYDTARREVHGSKQNFSATYPAGSPLPRTGDVVTDYVATRAGTHYVGVAVGDGPYDLTVEAYRPALEARKQTQTLFLDFDGAELDTAVFGRPGVRRLSPLSAFLPGWGLNATDENLLIDRIVAGVTAHLSHGVRLNIRNSRDHAAPWGQPDVTRVIVGGTAAEFGVEVIGTTESIDPGNFATAETAVTLLDVVSEPAGHSDASVNTYLTEGGDRVPFIARALSNLVAHEAGHLFGNFHTDNHDGKPNLMDIGNGNFAEFYGVGPDTIGGTADDVDVDFGEGSFAPSEGFTGTQDTRGRIARVVGFSPRPQGVQ